jgi:hypothetical protein
MGYLVGLIIPLAVFSIPITAIVLSYKRKTQLDKIKEMELQKEILELEIEKQNSKVKLLEEENKRLDKMIFESN